MTSKSSSYQQSKFGLAPGTLVYTGRHQQTPFVESITYNKESFHRERMDSWPTHEDNEKQVWHNLVGLSNIELLETLRDKKQVHNLVLEDILSVRQPARFEDFDDYVFLTLKMLRWDDATRHFDSEHISFLLFQDQIISFQEVEGDVFEPVRNRLSTEGSKIRNRKAEYLIFALVDAVIDNYHLIVDELSEHINQLEEKLLDHQENDYTQEINAIRKKLIEFRRFINPLFDAMKKLSNSESNLISEGTKPFILDGLDHLSQISRSMEYQSEVIKSLFDLQMANINGRMNEVMKTLTIIATIFIPLTFLAGIYGMNFENMPELGWENGYFTLLGIMAVVFLGMFLFFKRRKWW